MASEEQKKKKRRKFGKQELKLGVRFGYQSGKVIR